MKAQDSGQKEGMEVDNQVYVSNTPFGGGPYPAPAPYAGGFQNSYAGPANGLGYSGPPAASGGGGGGLSGLLGGLGNIRQIIDRMGGIDGVLDNVTKIQKIMSSLQQMGPMLKLVMGAAKSNGAGRDADLDPSRKRRRRRRRRRGRRSSGRSPRRDRY